MADLAANRVDRQLGCLRKISDAVAVRQNHRLMIALLIEQPAIALRAERFDGITIVHVQSARGRQRQQLGGELLRAQPAAGRIGDAAAAGIDAGQPGNLFRCHRAGDVRGKFSASIWAILCALFLIPAELGNTAPLVIEHHRQRVIHSAGEGKGGRKKRASAGSC